MSGATWVQPTVDTVEIIDAVDKTAPFYRLKVDCVDTMDTIYMEQKSVRFQVRVLDGSQVKYFYIF